MLLVETQAHQARADALLVAAMMGAVLPLACIYVSRASSPPAFVALGFWASLAVSILIKGPVVPAVIVLGVATLILTERDWRWLAPLKQKWGIALFFSIVLPWPVAMLWQHGVIFL
jgi:4-amino-4-deoxy-L-arabinose transferase-like glycosyltransferase